jgi:IS5 family transposase
MKPKKQESSTCDDLFCMRLEQILDQHGRYAHARQMKRARREQKRLKTYLGRVICDIERKLAVSSQAGQQEVARLLPAAADCPAHSRTTTS